MEKKKVWVRVRRLGSDFGIPMLLETERLAANGIVTYPELVGGYHGVPVEVTADDVMRELALMWDKLEELADHTPLRSPDD